MVKRETRTYFVDFIDEPVNFAPRVDIGPLRDGNTE